jgi:hypothetical protein
MSQTYDNTGTAALWSNEKYEAGGSHPRLKGSFYAHRDIKAGEQIDIALWDSNSENPKAPALKGKVSDKYVADGGAPAGTQANDSIPF